MFSTSPETVAVDGANGPESALPLVVYVNNLSSHSENWPETGPETDPHEGRWEPSEADYHRLKFPDDSGPDSDAETGGMFGPDRGPGRLSDAERARLNGGGEATPAEKKLRRFMWELADAYRPEAPAKVADCCHKRIAPDVRFDQRGSDPVFLVGVATCQSVWECPVCSLRIHATRTPEVQQVLAWHTRRYGEAGAWMLTLTVRHWFGADLRMMRRGMAKAWGGLIAGRAWGNMKRDIGYEGFVRTVEVTRGPHGWHPHFHCAMLTRRAPDKDLRVRLWARWADMVERYLGAQYRPTVDGVYISRGASAEYVTKMGLKLTVEICANGTKEGRTGPDGEARRTPIQILADWAQRGGDPADLALYREYVAGMQGAKMLNWSVGLRKRARLAEDDSDASALARDAAAPRVRIGVVSGVEWDKLRWIPGAKAALCYVAARWGTKGLYRAVDMYLEGSHVERPDDWKRKWVQADMDIVLTLRGGWYVTTV